jgi:osmotically-inducible protein OsmY
MSGDNELRDAVLAELAWEPSVTAGHIGVTARDGVVMLSGHVGRFAEKQAAEAAARRVRGVKALAEEIVVRLPLEANRDDEDIARAAVTRLAWNASLPRDAIKIAVEKGWVTLSGELDWGFERDAAAQEVRELWGVVGVTNKIRVKSRVDTFNLTSEITQALHRSWLDPKGVKVSADGGRVTLSGYVGSWNDRALAGSTAWAAPGATDVENHLIIS